MSAAPTIAPFARGDHLELATRLLADLTPAGADTAPVNDQGALHTYDPATGVWSAQPDARAAPLLLRYAGAAVTGSRSGLRIDAADVRGVWRVAADIAHRAGYFDAAPPGVAFKNGFVVLRDGRPQLLRHSPAYRARHALAFDYDARAAAPRWVQYWAEVFDGQPDRDGRVDALEEYVGASMFGTVAKYQTCVLLVGEGSDGKSVFLATAKELFPQSAVRASAPHLWQNNFMLAAMVGAQINIVNEMPAADVAASETFKAVVSGDAVTAAHKNGHPFVFACRAGHIFAANALPGTPDQSHGYWRRWLVFTFARQFEGAAKDPDLRAKLRRELPGIAARMVAAAARLQARGHLVVPESSKTAKAEWQRDSDQVALFLADRDTLAGIRQANADRALAAGQRNVDARWTRARHLYESFAYWARTHGHKGMSETSFGRRVSKLLADDDRNSGRWYALPDAASQPVTFDAPTAPPPPARGGSPNPPPNPPRATAQNATTVAGVAGVASSENDNKCAPTGDAAATHHDPATHHSPQENHGERGGGLLLLPTTLAQPTTVAPMRANGAPITENNPDVTYPTAPWQRKDGAA